MSHISYLQIAAVMRRHNNHVDMRFPTQVHLAIEHYMKEPSPRRRGRSRSASASSGSSASPGSGRRSTGNRRDRRGRTGRRTGRAGRSASASASPKHTMSSVDDLYKALVASSKTQSSGFLGNDADALAVEDEVRAGRGPGPSTTRLYNAIREVF